MEREADFEGGVVPCDCVGTDVLAAPGAPCVLSGVLGFCIPTDLESLSASCGGDDFGLAVARGECSVSRGRTFPDLDVVIAGFIVDCDSETVVAGLDGPSFVGFWAGRGETELSLAAPFP